MKRILLATAILALAGSTQAGDSRLSVGSCAALLPQGKSYEFSITGSARHEGQKVKIKTNVSVSGESGSAESQDFEKEIEPFQKCLSALISG